MSTLMPALHFFELLVSSYGIIVDVVGRQDAKSACCLGTAIFLMARIETIDGHFWSCDMASVRA